MREIKFKVWDTEKKCWNDRREIWVNLCPDGEIVWGDFDGDPNDNDGRFEMKLFTGLKDKNGKEIYEGDILEYLGNRLLVKWDTEMAAFQTENIKDKIDADFFNWATSKGVSTKGVAGFYGDGGNCAVIGNTYETPELLEAKP